MLPMIDRLRLGWGLAVPMHLGLTTGPLCSMSNHGSTVTLLKFQMALRLTLSTFWRRNYFFNFSTSCTQHVNNTGTKYFRIIKQTTF